MRLRDLDAAQPRTAGRVMARPPLDLETWGKIRRTTVGGKPTAVAYYRDSDGATRKMQRQGTTPAEAERNLKRAIRDRLAPAGEDLTGDSTIKQAAQKWLDEPETQSLAIGSLRRYKAVIDTIVADGFGGVRLSEATVPRVDRFLKATTANHGPGTAKTARTVLQHTLAIAVRHGAIRSNPVRDAGRIIQARKPVVAPDVATVREMQSLMRAYDATPDKRGAKRTADLGDVFALYTGTGARTAEILALRWADVDLDSTPATVTITATVAIGADGKIFRQEHPKTDTSRRELKLPQFAVDVLVRRRIESYCDWVFPSATGTLRWPHNLRRNWREALEDTPYADVTPRALRKAVATLLRDELGVEAARDQLGHATEMVTRKHYIQPAHIGPDATSALDAFGKTASK